MFKRRIRRKRKIAKLKNPKMMISFLIAMFLLGTAYASLNQVVTLVGNAEIYTGRSSLTKGNMDAYIVDVAAIWKSANGWNVDLTIRVHNPNNFDTTNWDATILVPGLIDAASYNLNDLRLEPENELIIVTNVDGSDQGKVKIDESRDYGMSIVCSDELLEEVLRNLTDEELALMTEADKNVIYNNGSDALSSDFKDAVISKIIYNMNATPEPTPNVIEIVANTTYEAEYELENFSYKCGDLSFDVNYTSYVRWDGRYITTAEINVTNNNSSSQVKEFSFDMVYNEPLSDSYYNSVVSNWNNDGNGTNFENHSNLNQTSKTTDSSSYKSTSSDGYELLAGETKTYHITQIVTDKKFKSFTFGNVKYTLSDGTTGGSDSSNTNTSTNTNTNTDTNTNTNIITNTNTSTNTSTNTNTNTSTNTIIDPTEPSDVCPLNFDVTYQKVNWGYEAYIVKINITNTSDKTVTSCSFDTVYDTVLSDDALSKLQDVTYPVTRTANTNEYASYTTNSYITIPANSSMAEITLQVIDASTGFTSLSIENIVYQYAD